MVMASLDPDFRRSPKTETFCVRCQKDIFDASKAIRVTVDWNTWETEVDANGEHLIGRDCAKVIGL